MKKKEKKEMMEQILEIGELFEKITKEEIDIGIGKAKWFNNEERNPNFVDTYEGDLYLCINQEEPFYVVDDGFGAGAYVFCNVDDMMENTKLNDNVFVKICKILAEATKKEIQKNAKNKEKINIMNGLIMKLNDVVIDLSKIESNE